MALLCAASANAQTTSAWIASQWHLWRMEVDGTGLMPLDETPGRRCGSPVWSPDGKHIAYDIDDTNDIHQVVVVRSDGSQRRVLGKGAIASWSTDGKLILCQSGGKCVMNLDGTGRERLPGFGHSLRWIPRNDRIAVIAGAGFAVLDLATGEEHLVSVGAYPVQHGYDISADGRRVCYGSKTAGLCLATFDADYRKAKIERLVAGGVGYHASWSPDAKRIVFAWQKSPSERTQLYFYDTESRGEPKLVPGLDLNRHNLNPDWSPDGNTIVFSRSDPIK